MTQQQTYPIQQLNPTSTQEDLDKALQATIAQLVSEGVSQEEASTQAAQMLQQVQQSLANAAVPRKGVTDYSQQTMNKDSAFMRSAGGQGVGTDNSSSAYNSVLNPWYTNFNPTTVGGYSNK